MIALVIFMAAPCVISNEKTDEIFEISKKLGRGSFGTTYLIKDTDTDEVFAYKRLSSFSRGEGIYYSTMREIATYCHFGNLPKVKIAPDLEYVVMDSPVRNRKSGIIMELYDRPLHCVPFKSATEIEHVCKLLFQKLAYAHVIFGVSHRDIKPANIMVSKDLSDAVLIDWGSSRIISNLKDGELPAGAPRKSRQQLTHCCCTMWYRAPEQLMGYTYYDQAKGDLWSLGISIFHILHQDVFSEDTEPEMFFKLVSLFGTPVKESSFLRKLQQTPKFLPRCRKRTFSNYSPKKFSFSKNFLDLMDKVLVIEPSERISLEEVVMHPFIAGMPAMAPITPVTVLTRTVTCQPDLNYEIYRITFDWVYIACLKHYGIEMSLVPFVIDMIYEVFHNRTVFRKQVQLVALTCISIASKLMGLGCFEFKTHLRACRNSYTINELEDMEFQLFTQLASKLVSLFRMSKDSSPARLILAIYLPELYDKYLEIPQDKIERVEKVLLNMPLEIDLTLPDPDIDQLITKIANPKYSSAQIIIKNYRHN